MRVQELGMIGRYVDVESGTTVGCWGGRDMNVSERAVLQATPVVF